MPHPRSLPPGWAQGAIGSPALIERPDPRAPSSADRSGLSLFGIPVFINEDAQKPVVIPDPRRKYIVTPSIDALGALLGEIR